MDLLDKELGKQTDSLLAKQESLAKAISNAETLEKKLVESKDIIRDNNHVIEWLHRQLNESALATDFDRYAGTSRVGGMVGPPAIDFTKPDAVGKSTTPRYSSRPPTALTSPVRHRQQQQPSRQQQQPSPHMPVYHSKISSQVGTGVSVTGAASGSGMMRGGGRTERATATGDCGGVKSNYFQN
jgi:hypothetical protein